MKVLSYSSIKKRTINPRKYHPKSKSVDEICQWQNWKATEKNKTSKRIAIPHQQQFFSILYSHMRKLSAILAAADCIFFNQLEPGVIRDLIRTNNSSGRLETCRTWPRYCQAFKQWPRGPGARLSNLTE